MAFSKDRFTLHFSMPLVGVDWDNLSLSRVRLVMLPLGTAMAMLRAGENGLARLGRMGVSVVLRVEEDTYYSDDAPERIRNQVEAVARFVRVEAVIVGNEPDITFRLDYGSPDWGQAHAYEHRRRFDAVRVPLQKAGRAVVSPGWGLQVLLRTGKVGRSISEDDPPAPGAVAWREIACLPNMQYTEEEGRFGYLSADGNGWHEYQYGWHGWVDELRERFSVKRAAEWWHKPLWICEMGVPDSSAQTTKMGYYIDQAEMLISHPLSARVRMVAFFVANGDPGPYPHHWDPRYLIQDPAAYRMLGEWMAHS